MQDNVSNTNRKSELKWWIVITVSAVAVGSVASMMALTLSQNGVAQVVLFIVTALIGAMVCRGVGNRLQQKSPDLLAASATPKYDAKWWAMILLATMAVGSFASAVAITLVQHPFAQIILFMVTAMVGAVICRAIGERV